MSFDESMISTGFTYKTTKGDLFVKGKFKIKVQHIRGKALKGTRRQTTKDGPQRT